MIFGSYLYDISTIARTLNELGYSYTLVGRELQQVKVIRNSTTLPYPVYVVDGLNRTTRYLDGAPSIIIICDSKSMLLNSNVNHEMLFPHYTSARLASALKKVLRMSAPQELEIKEPTLQEIIDKVTTKSILTDIQTLVNKVNPYDLRKKVHRYVISYLYGAYSYTKVIHFLDTASKLEAIRKVVSSKEAKNMRNAVMQYIKTKDEEGVSKQFGVHTFEVLYVFNSYDRLGSENDH